MALLITAQCDRCPHHEQFDPSKQKVYTYIIDQDGVARSGEIIQASRSADPVDVRPASRTVKLPEGWGVLELNVGHDKQVQELCPHCVDLNRSFMDDPSRLLAAPKDDAAPAPDAPRTLPPESD